MTAALDKGDALERAVLAIESTILESSPALREKTFVIESKKRVRIDGVLHEIDVYVEVDLGKGYKSVFIFECKHWKDAVGKNDIIVFSEKIAALDAQRGFFVAKSFTADAVAQAEKDSRLELLNVTEMVVDNEPVPFDLHFVAREKTNVQLHVSERKSGRTNAKRKEAAFTIHEARALLRDKVLDLGRYVQDWASEAASERERTFPSGTLSEGVYEIDTAVERTFEPGELTVNGRDIERATLHVECSVRVLRPAVLRHFEVETRGRVLSLAPVEVGGQTIHAGFVAT